MLTKLNFEREFDRHEPNLKMQNIGKIKPTDSAPATLAGYLVKTILLNFKYNVHERTCRSLYQPCNPFIFLLCQKQFWIFTRSFFIGHLRRLKFKLNLKGSWRTRHRLVSAFYTWCAVPWMTNVGKHCVLYPICFILHVFYFPCVLFLMFHFWCFIFYCFDKKICQKKSIQKEIK